jgi:hypothetical protein
VPPILTDLRAAGKGPNASASRAEYLTASVAKSATDDLDQTIVSAWA